MVRFFLQQNGQRDAAKFRRENRPHAVRHVHFAAEDLLHGVRDRGDLNMPEAVQQCGIIGCRRLLLRVGKGREARKHYYAKEQQANPA